MVEMFAENLGVTESELLRQSAENLGSLVSYSTNGERQPSTD
jgi:hypothetical protein